MKTFLIPYVSALVGLIIIDGTWLTIMGKSFYSKYLGHLMSPSASWIPVIIFYLLYAAGIVLFVTMPSLRDGAGILKVFLMGAFLGLVAYGAYDFTNQATLKDWPVLVTVVDLAWGAILTGVASVVSVIISKI